MTTTTNVEQVKLNVMTKAQYNAATKANDELYFVTDEQFANDDLSNITADAKDTITDIIAPDYASATTLSNITTYQQVPDNGYIWWFGSGGGTVNNIGIYLSYDGVTDFTLFTIANAYEICMCAPIAKGQYVKAVGNTTRIDFVPFKKL